MWLHVVSQIYADVLEEPAATILSAKPHEPYPITQEYRIFILKIICDS